MKKGSVLLLLTVAFFKNTVNSQDQINLLDQQEYYTNYANFYDDGGPNGEMSNTDMVCIIKRPGNQLLKLFIEEIDIPNDASLRIYAGADTSAQSLLGEFNAYSNHKPWTYYQNAFTIVYQASSAKTSHQGWKGWLIPQASEINRASMPESDCVNALPLCGNSTVNTSANQYDDTGQVNDDAGSCYSGTGNGGSVWYEFSPQTTGPLDFSISPTGSTDYDFVLWDITNGCSNKTELSCNYAAPSGATGLSTTGAATNSQDASGTKWNQRYNVDASKTYAICINYYSGNNDGFQLDFQNDPTSVAIEDNTPPTITNAYTDNCASASDFTIEFSEYIDCTTLDNTDFSIPGYTVTITNDNCVNGRTTSIEVSVSPALTPGTYTLTGNSCTDMCGNPLNDTYSIVTTSVPTANAGPDQVACSTAGFFGSTNYGTVTLTGTGGTSGFWSTGQTGNSVSVTPTTTTTYTYTAIDGSCSATDDVTVVVSASPDPNLGPDQTICSGFNTSLSSGASGVTYEWETTTTTGFFGTPNNWSTIGGATSSNYTTPNITTNTYYQVTVTDANGCSGTDWILIEIGSGVFGITGPQFICEGDNATLTLPSSMTDYTWSTGGSGVGTANTDLVVAPTTTTTYTATSTTAGCAGTADLTVNVHPSPAATITANPMEACGGDPVTLTSAGVSNSSSNDTEDFESGNTFTLVNDAFNNWYTGSATNNGGANGLYIGTSAANNNYDIGTAGFFGSNPKDAINHAYKDYAITSYCTANFSYDWRCNGQSGEAELRVYLVPTTYTPVAGTAITASATEILIGGPYTGSTAYTTETIDLSSYAGQSVRIVFEWENTAAALFGGPTVANPAAAIDNVILDQSTTYTYSWSSNPAGLSANTQNVVDNPMGATDYSLVATRCDGCAVTQSLSLPECSVLAIELAYFDGEANGRLNELNWVTLSETESNHFLLERSSDGYYWENIAQIEASGNSTIEINYEYYDQYWNPGVNYYRLTEVDVHGIETKMNHVVKIVRASGKKVIGATNLLGQNIDPNSLGVIILLYEDGSSEKVVNLIRN